MKGVYLALSIYICLGFFIDESYGRDGEERDEETYTTEININNANNLNREKRIDSLERISESLFPLSEAQQPKIINKRTIIVHPTKSIKSSFPESASPINSAGGRRLSSSSSNADDNTRRQKNKSNSSINVTNVISNRGRSLSSSSAASTIGILPRRDDRLLTRSLTLEKSAPQQQQQQRERSKKKLLEKMAGAKHLVQNNTQVIAQVGGTATLSCYTGHISDEMVTWLKREDDQLLTIGQELYANEARFSASISHSTKAWELFVRDVQMSDAGQYECQLTTHPPVTFLFSLKVTQAKAEIRGPAEVHIEEGSQLALQCLVQDSPHPPVYIFWIHNGTMVNYESERGLEVHLENFESSLIISKVTPSDAGIYTCDPHLAKRAKVVVHVVTGEKPAAMQHGRNTVNGSGSVTGPMGSSSSSVNSLFLLVLPAVFFQLHSAFMCSVLINFNDIYTNKNVRVFTNK